MAIERSLPFVPTIKKVREKGRGGGGGYSRGALTSLGGERVFGDGRLFKETRYVL